MSLTQQLLSNCLRNRNPQLDLQGLDKKILHIASQDFMNYLKFHWKLTDPESTERIREYLREKPGELKEFLNVWSGVWLKKWNERVKLVTETEEAQRLRKNHKRLNQAKPTWRKLRNRNEIKDAVVEMLIRNGEICGTSILAEHLLKNELASRTGRKISANSLKHLLDITNRALSKARHLSRNKGPTIFIITRKSRLIQQ